MKALRKAKISIIFGSVRFQIFFEELACDCGSMFASEVDCQPLDLGGDEEFDREVFIMTL